MIHEWFVSFGWIAALAFFVPLFVTKRLVNRNKNPNADDKQGRAMGFFALGFIGALAWAIGFICLLAGWPAAIPGWIGCAFFGLAIGVASGT